MRTRVVNIYRTKEYDIYIGRPGKCMPSKWGNPFHVGIDGNIDEVLAKYREYILSTPALKESLPELKGKVLGCFCKPKRCHGDVLVELVEGKQNKSLLEFGD